MYSVALMVKVAELYFYHKLAQGQIAKKLGISVPTVSRILNEALKSGVVKVEVVNFETRIDQITKAVQEKFGLKEIAVIKTPLDNDQRFLKKMLGKTAVDLLYKVTKAGYIIGIGPGETILEMIESLDPQRHFSGVKILPLMGGWGIGGVEYEVNKLVSVMATKLGCDFNLVLAPALVSSPEVKEIFLAESEIKEVVSMWDSVDVAIFSLGPEIETRNYPQLAYENERLLEAKNLRAVGDVLGRFIDENGIEPNVTLNKRMISIPFPLLKKIPFRIGIGGGKAKARAVKAALKGNLINILVTDDETCQMILEED